MANLGAHLTESAVSVNIDGIKKMVMHLLIRAQQDLLSYMSFTNDIDANIYHSAERMIFDDSFIIVLDNGETITTHDLCVIIGGSLYQFRKQTTHLIESGVYDLEDYIVQ